VDGNVYVAGGLTKLSGASGNHFFRLQISGNNPLTGSGKNFPHGKENPALLRLGLDKATAKPTVFIFFQEGIFNPAKTLKFFTMLTFIIPGWNNGLLFRMEVRYSFHSWQGLPSRWELLLLFFLLVQAGR
jgi:hypothetical protein